MNTRLSRREVLAGAAAALGAARAALASAHTPSRNHAKMEYKYSLNTSTIQGQKLSLVEEVEVAAKAGYDAVEPWISEIDAHVKAGGSLRDLGARIRDHGLTVESAIGFFAWIVDDATERAKALDEAKRNMEMLAQIGGKRIAAPPVGATERTDLPLLAAAERYRALLEVGDQCGVVPQVEVWGFSKTLTRLGEAALVAIESGHPNACILADVYHLYKGGSPLMGLTFLNGAAMHNFHLNDYPADPPRDRITDADRVYPGDGVAPLTALFQDLRRIGYQGALSIELFNRAYWQQDALTVARTGLQKLKAVVRKSLSGG